ncbi:MAG TPA: NACHT domain-containing protein [Longimicrobium sp.]
MSTIQQHVTGAGNLFTATGDVYQVSYHLDPPTAADRRNLANLLGHVKRTWITDVLERAVHDAPLALGMREAPDAVEHPWERVLERPAEPGRVLPPDAGIGRVFDDVGRLLLILGEPGSGKTTTLLTLARECVRRAEEDPSAPVPVVLSLSTWAAAADRSLHEWIVGELGARYYVGRATARQWLAESRLLLLLDGLDEVSRTRRAACVEAIRAFVQEHGVPGLAVCCRASEYRALPVRLSLGGAVVLQPLSHAQVDGWLRAGGAELASLRGALSRSPELRALAESPLMLSVMTLAFRGAPPGALDFADGTAPGALRDRIFAVYVDRMFERRGRGGRRPPRARAEGWLRWLAAQMARQGQTLFSVELLQPAWLPSARQRMAYVLTSRLAAAVVLGVAWGAILGFVFSLPMLQGIPDGIPRGPDPGFLAALGRETPTRVAFGAACGVATGLLCCPFELARLRPSRARAWTDSPPRTLLVFIAYAVLGTAGCLLSVAVFPQFARLLPGFRLLWGIAFAMFLGVRPGRGSAEGDIGWHGVWSWRWGLAARNAVVGLWMAVLAGIVFHLVGGEAAAARGPMLPHLGRYALVGALFGANFGGWCFRVPPTEPRLEGPADRPLRTAVKAAATVAAVGGVGTALLFGLFPVGVSARPGLAALVQTAALVSLDVGALAFLWFGGLDLVLHGTLRLLLVLSGAMPWRVHRFLRYSVSLVFLRRAGNGYIFIHRLLLEHFAARPAALPVAPA